MTADLLSDVLRVVRLDGAFFYRVEACEPWWVESRAAREEAPLVLPHCEHLIPYHILIEGRCWGGLVGERQREMRPGDVLVVPSGRAHYMSSAEGLRTPMPPIGSPQGERLPFALRIGPGGAQRALLVCGYLGCDRGPFNPLLASLPPVLHVQGESGGWLQTFGERVLAEASGARSGGSLMLTRLAELMFIEVVRRHLEELPSGETGWLAGLRDEQVGRALSLLHARPAADWSLDELAQEASCSRSVLAERFTRLVGLPPMQYLSQWRMQLAAQRLSCSSAKVANIGRDLGYESEAAFSRAFKRLTGTSPATWRARRAIAQ